MVVIQKVVKVVSVDNQKVVNALRVVKKGTATVTTLTTQKWSIMTTF